MTGYECCAVNAIHIEAIWRREWRGKPPRSAVTAVKCIDWRAERLAPVLR